MANVMLREWPDYKPPELSDEQLGYIRKFSNSQLFDAIKKEYERTRRERCIKTPKWYTLFGGPRDIQRLAQDLSLERFYVDLYRDWSASAHAVDSSPYIETLPDGTVAGHQLRLADNMIPYSFYAGWFICEATDLMMMKFRPFEKSHAIWSDEVRKRLEELLGVKVEVFRRG